MARMLLNGFDAATHVGERHNWMLVLAPEQPVAGEDCIVLFNRAQSEILRCACGDDARKWAMCTEG